MNRKIRKYLLLPALTLFGAGALIHATRDDFGLNRNMEILVNLMRELATVYVDEADPDTMMQGAALGMVRSLDPYTEFISEKDLKAFETLSMGKYGGIGSMIRQREDYVCIAQPYKGSPADKAGLKIGDRIVEVNGKDARGFTTEQVSSELRGEPGSSVRLLIEHLDGTRERYEIRRERISIPGVPYVGWVNDSIGYVRHSDFYEGCYEEIRNGIAGMHRTGRLKGLVLDYRSNGGGFLHEAVKILSLFLPQGTEVMNTKGRNKQLLEVYRTDTRPLFPDLPIAVLINGSSASSTEIVTGALQDMDRAVVIGQRSFGKGLVQTTRPTGYNSIVKVTTAKYYIPSGRCIQAIDYSRSQQGVVTAVPDSLINEFKTRNGRKVYDGGGIMPDIPLKPEYISRFTVALYAQGLINDFGDEWTLRHPDTRTDTERFSITDADYADFVEFMKDKKVEFKSETRHLLEQLERASKDEDFTACAEAAARMKEELRDDTQSNLQTYRDQIVESINTDLIQRQAYTEGVIRHSLLNDKEVQRAVELLLDPQEYGRILTSQDTQKK